MQNEPQTEHLTTQDLAEMWTAPGEPAPMGQWAQIAGDPMDMWTGEPLFPIPLPALLTATPQGTPHRPATAGDYAVTPNPLTGGNPPPNQQTLTPNAEPTFEQILRRDTLNYGTHPLHTSAVLAHLAAITQNTWMDPVTRIEQVQETLRRWTPARPINGNPGAPTRPTPNVNGAPGAPGANIRNPVDSGLQDTLRQAAIAAADWARANQEALRRAGTGAGFQTEMPGPRQGRDSQNSGQPGPTPQRGPGGGADRGGEHDHVRGESPGGQGGGVATVAEVV